MTTTIYLETGEAVQMTDSQRSEYARTGVWPPPISSSSVTVTPVYNPLPPIYGSGISPIVQPSLVVPPVFTGPVLPTPIIVAPPAQNIPPTLEPFKSGDSYNLLDIVQAGTPGQILMAKQTWPDQDWNYLEYAARPIWDISTKEGFAAYNKLTTEKQQLFRPVMDVTIDQYARMTDREKLSVKSIVAKEVSPEVYSKLGPGTKPYAAPQKLTPIEQVHEMAEGIIPVYGTMRYWNTMPTWSKALSVVGDIFIVVPAISTMAKELRIVSVVVPTESGAVTVWKGIAPGGKPVFGITKGSLSLGARGAQYPTLSKITAGYEPVTKLENSIMAATKALKTMGVSKNEINRLMITLGERGKFAGKVSPYLEKTFELPTVERLTQDETATIFKVTKGYGKKIDRVFGTVSMEPQIPKEFKLWRGKHDIDIATKMSQDDTSKFTNDILKQLQKKGDVAIYRISADAPGAIEKNINGVWQKITDIHSAKDIVSGAKEVSPTAREGAYGMMHNEKPVTINYPGIGKVDIMTLSEMGKRKAQSILRWHNGKFAPYDYRVKDITDFWVIDRTFRGEEAANAWARAYGFDPAELMKLAKKNPPIILGWEFTPESKISGALKGAKSVSKISPSIRLNVNNTIKSLTAESTKSSIASSISKLSESKVSLRAYKPAISGEQIKPSAYTSTASGAASISRKASTSGGNKPSGTISGQIKPVSGSISGSKPSSSGRTSPSGTISPPSKSAPPVSPPSASVPPVSPPSMPTTPVEPTAGRKSTPILPISVGMRKEARRKLIQSGTVAWKQGLFYKVAVIQNRKLIVLTTKQKPEGVPIVKGIKSAFKTLTRKGAYFPPEAKYDMGIMDVKITKKGKKIRFVRDIKRKTHGNYIKGDAELIVRS